jgi:hypothetical protein
MEANADATRALELWPTLVKAYLRKGCVEKLPLPTGDCVHGPFGSRAQTTHALIA